MFTIHDVGSCVQTNTNLNNLALRCIIFLLTVDAYQFQVHSNLTEGLTWFMFAFDPLNGIINVWWIIGILNILINHNVFMWLHVTECYFVIVIFVLLLYLIKGLDSQRQDLTFLHDMHITLFTAAINWPLYGLLGANIIGTILTA